MRAVRQILAVLLVVLATACAIPSVDAAATPSSVPETVSTCASGDRTVLFYWSNLSLLDQIIEGGDFASIVVDNDGAVVIEPASGREVLTMPFGRYALSPGYPAGGYVVVCTVPSAATR